jgi:type IV pilus assembly protein PilP
MSIMHVNRPSWAARRMLLAALAAAATLTACAPGMSDLQAWVSEVKARPPKPLDPLPVMQQFETFEYAAQAMRDPFSGPAADQEGGSDSGLRPDPTRRKEPLEAYPLDSLDMVGTIGEGEGMIALIMDPERVVHQVLAGQYMGQSDGRIIGIHEDRIDLTELVPDGAGGWMERQAQVALDDK